jgi:long-chain acyl-CoA synthetase
VILRRLFEAEHATPSKAAVIHGDTSISYGELAARVRATAEVLRAQGLERGDRIALAAATADFAVAYLAVHCLGAIAMPLPPRIRAAGLEQIREIAGPSLCVGLESIGSDAMSYEALRAAARDDPGSGGSGLPDGVRDSDPADLLFTTGTTGRPKGVLLSHQAIETSARHTSEFLRQHGGDIEVLPLPLSHSFGLGRLRCCIYRGSTLVLVEGPAVFADAMRALRRFSATGFSSVPSGMAAIFQSFGDALGEFSGHLRYVEIGSAPMPLEHKRRLMALLPDTRICMHYGLTEASRSAFIEFHESSDRLDSVGRPSPGVEIRIVDEHGDPCPHGTEGRIAIRSGALMTSYWGASEETNAALSNGWLLTEDRGRLEKDGDLYLTGRESELINVGGRKVSPAEIEALLLEHPAVLECACIGIPDPRGLLGQVVKAVMVARDGEGAHPTDVELARHLRGRIEPYKMPRIFAWTDRLPRSDSGKVLRGQLAQELHPAS